MGVNLHIMDKGRPLGDRCRIRVLTPINAAIATLMRYAPALDADLVIIPTDIYSHPRWYRSGKAYGPGYAQIEFNPDHPRFETEWDTEASALVIHELHHCLRWPFVSNWTIGEVIVLEGLAMLAEGWDGHQAMDYGNPLPTPVLDKVCMRALEEREREETEDTRWFRDTCVGDIFLDAPVNYQIGKRLMQLATTKLNVDPFQAASLPTETLLRACMTG